MLRRWIYTCLWSWYKFLVKNSNICIRKARTKQHNVNNFHKKTQYSSLCENFDKLAKVVQLYSYLTVAFRNGDGNYYRTVAAIMANLGWLNSSSTCLKTNIEQFTSIITKKYVVVKNVFIISQTVILWFVHAVLKSKSAWMHYGMFVSRAAC